MEIVKKINNQEYCNVLGCKYNRSYISSAVITGKDARNNLIKTKLFFKILCYSIL